MSGVQAKTCRESCFCSSVFVFFFFFSESAPLLACSEHRCTRQEGFFACCWREAGYCTTDFPLCLRALTEVPKALTDRAYRPKRLRVLTLSTAIKHRVMHFCQLHLCFCLLHLLTGLLILKEKSISLWGASHHQLFHFQGLAPITECG